MIYYILAAILAIFMLSVCFGPPYVPSHRRDLKTLWSALALSKQDMLIDLGSGDGVVLRSASQYIQRGLGFEINPLLVCLSRVLSRRYLNLEFKLANARCINLPVETSVVYLFGTRHFIKQIVPLLLAHQGTIKIVSYAFPIPDLKQIDQIGAHYIYENKKNFTKSNRSSIIA